MMKNISIIVAVAQDGAIGKDGDLLCHMSADLKRFKALTTGHSIVMGRRTYDSLPKGALPNRRNIVVTRNPQFSAPGVEVALSLDEAFRLTEGEDEVFVIGGEQIYRAAIGYASRLYLTEIGAQFEGADAFFPEVNLGEWHLANREAHEADERNPYPYAFANYER